MKGNAESIAWR